MTYVLKNNSTLPSFDPYQASARNIKTAYTEQRSQPVYTDNLNCRVGKKIAEPWTVSLMANGGKLPDAVAEELYGIIKQNKALDILLKQQDERKKIELEDHHDRHKKKFNQLKTAQHILTKNIEKLKTNRHWIITWMVLLMRIEREFNKFYEKIKIILRKH